MDFEKEIAIKEQLMAEVSARLDEIVADHRAARLPSIRSDDKSRPAG